jgi:hypothetical protein
VSSATQLINRNTVLTILVCRGAVPVIGDVCLTEFRKKRAPLRVTAKLDRWCRCNIIALDTNFENF